MSTEHNYRKLLTLPSGKLDSPLFIPLPSPFLFSSSLPASSPFLCTHLLSPNSCLCFEGWESQPYNVILTNTASTGRPCLWER